MTRTECSILYQDLFKSFYKPEHLAFSGQESEEEKVNTSI